MKDINRIKLTLLVTAAVILTSLIYLKSARPINGPEKVLFPVLASIILIAVVFAYKGIKSVRSGLPLQDEYTRSVAYRAGYFAWIATIYLALLVGWFIDDVPGMMPRHGATATMLSSIIAYFIIYLILSKRGDKQ